MKKLWAIWKKVGHFIGTIIGVIISWIVYIVFITPVGLISTVFFDIIKIRKKYNSMWIKRKDTKISVEDMRRQY